MSTPSVYNFFLFVLFKKLPLLFKPTSSTSSDICSMLRKSPCVFGFEKVRPRKVGPASDLFCVLGLCLESCVLDSTSARPNNPKFDAVQLHPTPDVENSWLPDAHDSYAEDFTNAQPNTKTTEKQQLSFPTKIR